MPVDAIRLDRVLLDDLDHVIVAVQLVERVFRLFRPGVPLLGFGVTTELFENCRVRIEQAGAIGKCRLRIELRNLQLHQGGLGIAEIESRTRHRDRKLDLHTNRECGAGHGTTELERLLGATEPPFAVYHHRQLVIATRDAAVSAQFSQREGVILYCVSSDRKRFADHTDTACAPRCRDGMAVSELRVILDQACSHHEMLRNALCVLLAQGLQLVESNPVELFRSDILGDLGCLVIRTYRADAERISILGNLSLPGVPIPAGWCPALGPQALLAGLGPGNVLGPLRPRWLLAAVTLAALDATAVALAALGPLAAVAV